MSNFQDLVKAGYTLIMVETQEETRVIRTLAKEAGAIGYNPFSWDLVNGLEALSNGGQKLEMGDPVKFLKSIEADGKEQQAVYFVKDFHKFFGSVEVVRRIKNLNDSLKSRSIHIVFVSPVLNLPPELVKDVFVMDFSLPDTDEIFRLAESLVAENELDIKVDRMVIEAAKGLTLAEAENAISLSIVKFREIKKEVLTAEKLQAVRKGGMELFEPSPESELGGLDNLKEYIHNRLRGFETTGLPTPKGIMLFGLPGGGKSLAAKVIASVFKMPLLKFDMASLKGSLVGESEAKMRAALKLIDSIAPCVVWMDEIEKAVGGVQSSNRTDGGTSSAMFGQLLTWLQESKTPKYVVATCNDINELFNISQGALMRRFDDLFFVDLPTPDEREKILDIMNRRYGADVETSRALDFEGWTGAEIEKFVIASLYDGEESAFGNIKPISRQNATVINAARDWAKDNSRMANSAAPLKVVSKRKLHFQK